jgi:hypothetical protein
MPMIGAVLDASWSSQWGSSAWICLIRKQEHRPCDEGHVEPGEGPWAAVRECRKELDEAVASPITAPEADVQQAHLHCSGLAHNLASCLGGRCHETSGALSWARSLYAG